MEKVIGVCPHELVNGICRICGSNPEKSEMDYKRFKSLKEKLENGLSLSEDEKIFLDNYNIFK